jgi:hypothetical protein
MLLDEVLSTVTHLLQEVPRLGRVRKDYDVLTPTAAAAAART